MATYRGKRITVGEAEYVLEGELGRGGNGCVVAAKRADRPDEFAVKFFTIREDEPNYRIKKERFLHELKFCEKVDHKNVIRVLGHGEFNGQYFYIMPRYSKTLRTVIAQEKDFIKLMEYAIQLCEAVKYIHDQGVIHRDIKPENILLDDESNVVLADFGIAHFTDSSMTKVGDWLGNKNYAAPEQLLKGNAQNVSMACDVYAVGTVINELFTKSKPSGSEYQTIAKVVPQLLPMDRLVHRCIRQHPSERPHIDEVLAEIKLIRGDIRQAIETFLDAMEHNPVPSDKRTTLLHHACLEVVGAKYLFEQASGEEIAQFESFYHQNIRYRVSPSLRNMYYQRVLYTACLRKFNYEANVYARGESYNPLDFNKLEDKEIYDKFMELLNQHIVSRNDLRGRILKLFSSCCNYHCKEILRSAIRIENSLKSFDDIPILDVVYDLRQSLLPEDIEEIDLIDDVEINWMTTKLSDEPTGKAISKDYKKINEVFVALQKRWQVIWSEIENGIYSVKFRTRADYDCFVEYALALAKPHYVFEGDVLALITINRESEDIVELVPMEEYDVLDTLAKIVGVKPVVEDMK